MARQTGLPRLIGLSSISSIKRYSEVFRQTVQERKLDLKRFMTVVFAVAWLALIIPIAANAGSDTEPYLDGDVKEAIASGETVLLHYKSTW